MPTTTTCRAERSIHPTTSPTVQWHDISLNDELVLMLDHTSSLPQSNEDRPHQGAMLNTTTAVDLPVR